MKKPKCSKSWKHTPTRELRKLLSREYKLSVIVFKYTIKHSVNWKPTMFEPNNTVVTKDIIRLSHSAYLHSAFYPPFCTCYSASSFHKIPVADFPHSAFRILPAATSVDICRHHHNSAQPVHHRRHHCWSARNVATQPWCVCPLMRSHLLGKVRISSAFS